MNSKSSIYPVLAAFFAGGFLYQTLIGIPAAKEHARTETFSHITAEITAASNKCEQHVILDENNPLYCSDSDIARSSDFLDGELTGFARVSVRYQLGDFKWEEKQIHKDAPWIFWK